MNVTLTRETLVGRLHYEPATGVFTRRADSIQVDGRARHLGYFASPQEAHKAYKSAKRKLHEGCTI